MENVQFDESQQANSFNVNRQPKTSLLTRTIIKLGLANDQKGANKVMVVISVLCLLLMSYFIISTFFPNLLNFTKPKSTVTSQTLQQRLDALRNGTASTTN